MPPIETLLLFCGASFLLALTPGPDVLSVVARGLSQGRRSAFAAALGFSTGIWGHVLFALVGLSALIRASALAFQGVKYAGALYLLYLGTRMLLQKSSLLTGGHATPLSMRTVFFQSLLANILNPKVALFFLAFLPQFVDLSIGSLEGQMLIFGGIFWAITLLTFGMIGFFAGSLGQWLGQKSRLADTLQRLTGAFFVLLGLRLAMTKME